MDTSPEAVGEYKEERGVADKIRPVAAKKARRGVEASRADSIVEPAVGCRVGLLQRRRREGQGWRGRKEVGELERRSNGSQN